MWRRGATGLLVLVLACTAQALLVGEHFPSTAASEADAVTPARDFVRPGSPAHANLVTYVITTTRGKRK